MARLFNGTTDKVDCGASALLTPASGGVTYAGWVNLSTSTITDYGTPFASYGTGGTGIGIFVRSVSFKLAAYAVNSAVYDGTGTNALTVGAWTHIALTYNVGTGAGIGYFNGSVDGSGTTSAATPTANNFVIGLNSSASTGFHGSTADVGVWNVILTAGEVAALAQGARPYTIRRGSLQGYWPLDGLASPEPDLSDNIFNGTVTGTTVATGPPVAMFTPHYPFPFDVSGVAGLQLMGQAML